MTLPYQEPGRSTEERVSDLLARMTFEEKAAQMHALWLILSEDGEHRPREQDAHGDDHRAVTGGEAAGTSKPYCAAACSVRYGSVRCPRAIAQRSARPAATTVLTWSALWMPPTAITELRASGALGAPSAA